MPKARSRAGDPKATHRPPTRPRDSQTQDGPFSCKAHRRLGVECWYIGMAYPVTP